MTELEALKARHSVRDYQDKKIDPEVVAKLKSFIEECNKEGNLNLQLCEDAANTYNKLLNKFMGLGSAPSVIACVGPKSDDLHERVGYYGQKVVLYAQQLGLNTCWAGTFNKKTIPCKTNDNDEIVISIAIGYGATSGKERKSKSAADVTMVTNGTYESSPDWFKAGVEAALLAPTAINQQKFLITLDNGEVKFTDKGGVFSKVDFGIIKYQFEVGANSVKNA